MHSLIDAPDTITWLHSLGLEQPRQAEASLQNIARRGVPIDLVQSLVRQLAEHLPTVSDPDMAMNNLERFFQAARSPLALAALLDRDPSAAKILLRLFSMSQYLSNLLIRDPEGFDALRLTEGQPITRAVLVDELCAELENVDQDPAAMTILRHFKHRETLRIASGDIIGGQNIVTVTGQISYVAEAVCQAALQYAQRQLQTRYGTPRAGDGQPCAMVILAFGKLGGQELNYSSDVDLAFFYQAEGHTDGERSLSNAEFFQRVARLCVKLISEATPLGAAYRVDLRLRPDGSRGPLALSLRAALSYYDAKGRTWERQALIKARPVAGDLQLGRQMLDQLRPWIYARRLTRADIEGIQALKRRIEKRVMTEGHNQRNVKTGRGGIRDIEFVTQFLQLLHGRLLPSLQTTNTLEAISHLHDAGCLTTQEQWLLERNYQWLRKLEHRLQIMFDLQTHTLPESEKELGKLALRMGYQTTPDWTALEQFRHRFSETTQLNRNVLDHLLHNAFGPGDNEVSRELDLVLDPEPGAQQIQQVLQPYGFVDIQAAYRNLMALADEKTPFLSPHRTRHFFAAIARQLLQRIALTPDPDSTLVSLGRVSDRIGGKAVLWELLSYHRPSMDLYVRLCASSPYLCEILTGNPGMVDGLLDSLILQHLPSLEFLHNTLQELVQRAEDIDPILHSFKDSQHLRVGVRDLLGCDAVRDTHLALSNIAEVCLNAIAAHQQTRLEERLGIPRIRQSGKRCELVILALGKLGAQEPNYHSDLDVIFLYQQDGSTDHSQRERQTSNQEFFSRWAAEVTKQFTSMGPHGRLYEMDSRLRPTGKSGSLAISFDEFRRYFSAGQGQLWERMALCKARPVCGSDALRAEAQRLVYQAITADPWTPEMAEQALAMRLKMQENCSPRNLKRGAGGTVDVEFAVQLLQIKHAAQSPQVLLPGTLQAAQALHEHGYLQDDEYRFFSHAYARLRHVEARLRLMNVTARHDVPEEPAQLRKLAYLLRSPAEEDLQQQIDQLRDENRRRFLALIDRLASESAGLN